MESDVNAEDSFQAELLRQVRPADWRNPVPASQYDLVVIGGGTAGLVSAAGAAGLGARVALIERHLLGGDCLNAGCVPSKALLASAKMAAMVRRAPEFGIDAGPVRVDFPLVMQRLRRLRAEISRHDSAARFKELGVDVYLGGAEFDSPESVRVDGQTLRFRKAVICTGARPQVPAIPGLDTSRILTNESVFALTELPARLGVIGGGPIGCELAQAFARFGSRVTLLEAGPRLLPRDDPEAAEILLTSLHDDGVDVRLGTTASEVRHGPSATELMTRSAAQGAGRMDVDALLLAVGRTPNTEGLGLKAAGVEADASGIRVDDRLRTTNRRIFAAGDVASRFKFTHAADFLARCVIQNALFAGRQRASRLLIPWCTYTSPEVAHVGLLPEEASRQGVEVTTFVQPLAGVDRAVLEGETEGFVKLHVKRGSDRIVGATIVSAHAGDIISEVAVAMRNGVGLKAIAATIHPYPTQAEAIRKLGDQFNRTRLTPVARWVLRTVMRWT